MRLAELLRPERIRVPLRARSVQDGFLELRGLLGDEEPLPMGAPTVSPSGRTCLLDLQPRDGVPEGIAVGIAPEPLSGEDLPEPGGVRRARVLVLLSGVDLEREPRYRIKAAFFDPVVEDALLKVEGVEELLSIRRLMDTELTRPLLVHDAMVPLEYRIYPDTPLEEVLSLMVRRHLSVVPVVGEGLQVRGLISAAEILRFGLKAGPGRTSGGGKPPGTAKDLMSRSVLCVAEDESLADAAQVMAHRNADQLPVVRDGELVGFLTRDGVLTALFGERIDARNNPKTSEGIEE